MWLSKQAAESKDPSAVPPLRGTVTLSGSEAAVYTDAERRGLTVCAPGGYFWRPAVRDEVLVIKEGGRGYVVADLPGQPPLIQPGELLLLTGEAAVRLTPNGHVAISGTKVTVNDIVLYNEEDEEVDG